jgi:hypothetical protein
MKSYIPNYGDKILLQMPKAALKTYEVDGLNGGYVLPGSTRSFE